MKYLFSILLILNGLYVSGQETFPLYSGKIPNSLPHVDEEEITDKNGVLRVSKISNPTIRPYLPASGNGAAVIIFPGGGYRINAISHEGYDVAKKLNEAGIAAFVVKYRIPNDETMKNKSFGPLQDAQQAISLVRSRAEEWKIDPHRIGVMGFSAGGHLAATLSTHSDTLLINGAARQTIRPDFSLLIYPVISFSDSVGHIGSRDQLLGKEPTEKWKQYFSNELQISADTPPAFLVHAGDDDVVDPQNSILYFQGLLAHGIEGELHIYQAGGHGFGMNNPTSRVQWIETCLFWLDSNGWLEENN